MVIKLDNNVIINEVGTSEDVLFVVGKGYKVSQPKVQEVELAIAA